MVVECGNLTVDGFSLPLPMTKTMGDYMTEHPKVESQLKEQGYDIDNNSFLNAEIKVSGEALKTWLPCYKESTVDSENDIRNAIANGHIVKKRVGGRLKVTETTEGGILLFDEFFRADPHVFKILMQILENREFLGHVIGDKWAIVCCSNRPNDDAEAKSGFKSTGAVVGTRIDQMNFVPSFDEWKKWAQKEGMFDSDTLKFLMQDVDVKTGEYANWHTIDPDKYTSGESAWPTPRSWSKMMVKLRNTMDMEGYDTVLDVPREEIVDIASGFIGIEMAEKYAEYDYISNNNTDVTSAIAENVVESANRSINEGDSKILSRLAEHIFNPNATYSVYGQQGRSGEYVLKVQMLDSSGRATGAPIDINLADTKGTQGNLGTVTTNDKGQVMWASTY